MIDPEGCWKYKKRGKHCFAGVCRRTDVVWPEKTNKELQDDKDEE